MVRAMVVTEEVVQRVQSRVGTTIADKWRLTRVLGIGGMAAVYAAVHRNQHRVAIKMLHPEQSYNETVRTRFLREGYVANTVEHSGAVRVHDDGVVLGAAYLVMELLEGETLEDRRERHGGRLPVQEVLMLADRLLETLTAAHEKGIVHRDIKPDNLFLTTAGQLKVLDFGIARLHEISNPGSTTAGTFMGTPSFMSPEQARGRWAEVDARSDLWATGATLFYLLTGRLVHDGDTFADQLALAVREPAPLLGTVEPQLQPIVTELVDRALAYRPADRFPDAASMLVAVRAAVRAVGPPITSSIRAEGEDSSGRAPSDQQTLLATPDPVGGRREGRTSVPVISVAPVELSRSSRKRLLLAAALLGALCALLVWIRSVQSDGSEVATVAALQPAPAVSAEPLPPQSVPTTASRAAVAVSPVSAAPAALAEPRVTAAVTAPAAAQPKLRAPALLPSARVEAPKPAAAVPAPSAEPAAARSANPRSLLDRRF